MTKAKIIPAIIRGMYTGISTNHQLHVIKLVNLSVINTMANKPIKPMPLL